MAATLHADMASSSHPMRYLRVHPQFAGLLEDYRRLNGCGPPKPQTLLTVGQSFAGVYNGLLLGLPAERRPDSPAQVVEELSLFLYYATFRTSGSKLYCLSPELVGRFREKPLAAGQGAPDFDRLPARIFHVAFEPQRDLPVWDGEHLLDGAYVQWHARGLPLQILLTSRRAGVAYDAALNPAEFPNRYYYAALRLPAGRTLAEAVELLETRPRADEHDDLSTETFVRAAPLVFGAVAYLARRAAKQGA